MKKLIFTLFFSLTVFIAKAPEFKGSTYQIPRIEGERPQPNAYQYYTPTSESIQPDPILVIPATPNLDVNKTLENERPDSQNSVFDSPAMTRK